MRKTINALIIKDKKVLLFKKNLVWTLPGGKPKEGESHIETLTREFKEGAFGTEIEIGKYYGSFRRKAPHKKYFLEAVVYSAKLKNPESILKPSEKVKEIRFIGYPDTPFIHISDITCEVIKYYFNKSI